VSYYIEVIYGYEFRPPISKLDEEIPIVLVDRLRHRLKANRMENMGEYDLTLNRVGGSRLFHHCLFLGTLLFPCYEHSWIFKYRAHEAINNVNLKKELQLAGRYSC
jgi:hypothetical protein